ncbi:CMGC protein kinase [Podospora conica]|nr:CMGC protein kinase [Schizothecium conicum]
MSSTGLQALTSRALQKIKPRARPTKFPATDPVSDDLIQGERDDLDVDIDDPEVACYFPAKIGDILDGKYQVLGKLGCGITSAVWLARDLKTHAYLTLKINRDSFPNNEVFFFERITEHAEKRDPAFAAGHTHLRTAVTSFDISEADDKIFHVLVQKPLLWTWDDLQAQLPGGRFTTAQIKRGIRDVLLALDVLHVQCNIIHSDIKEANIFAGFPNKKACKAFVKAELASPSKWKKVGQASFPVYQTRKFDVAPDPRKTYPAVLGDLLCSLDANNLVDTEDIQPMCFRAPEVNLGIPWSYPIDIWNLGVLVALLVDRHFLFDTCREEEIERHLAEIVRMLGPPPRDLVQRIKRRKKLFAEDGAWNGVVAIPKDEKLDLDKAGQHLEAKDRPKYVAFLKSILKWRPEDRKTARELLDDPWLVVEDA